MIERTILQDDAEPGTPEARGVRRVDAEHLHLTAVATSESLEDLDRRALAGTVRPKQ